MTKSKSFCFVLAAAFSASYLPYKLSFSGIPSTTECKTCDSYNLVATEHDTGRAGAQDSVPVKRLEQVLDLVVNKPSLERLTPENAQKRLSKFVPDFREAWKTVKSENQWDIEAVQDGDIVRRLLAVFAPHPEKRDSWAFRDLTIDLRSPDAPALFLDVSQRLQHRLGKPKWLSPSRKRPTAMGWPMKDDWGVSLRLNQAEGGGNAVVELFVTSFVENDN